MASTSRQYSPTSDTVNGCRVLHMLKEPCSDLFRDLLRFYVPPNSITGKLQQEKKKKRSFLHNRNSLFTAELAQLIPTSGAYSGNYNEFDITFLYTLLRNLANPANLPPPGKGWGETPDQNDRSVAGNIERIRLLRNEMSHSSSLSMSDSNFTKIWSDIKQVVQELDKHLSNGGVYEKALDDLEHKAFDPTETAFWQKTLKRTLEENTQCKSDIKKLKTGHRKLNTKLEDMKNPIPKNIQEMHDTILEQWRQEDFRYYEPSFFDSLKEKVEKESCMLVIGGPGSGKTATIRHIALQFKNCEYEVVPVAKIKEVVKYGNIRKKQIFMLDNAFGDIGFKEHLHDKFKQYYENICTMLGDDSKLLMTSRTLVKMEAERCGLHSAIMENIFNLDDEENHLTMNDRMGILSCYMKGSSSFSKLKEYVKRNDTIIMFPLLCKLISSNPDYEREGCQFFKEPCQLIMNHLQELVNSKIKRIQYASLVICMLNKGRISEEDIEKESWIKEVLHKCCRVPKSTEIWEFTDALSDMLGTYTTKSSDGFVFLHDILFEGIVCCFGTQYPEEIIKRLPGELLSNKLVLQEKEKTNDLQIHIKQNMFPCLAQRLIKELKDLQLYVVFDSKLLRNRELQTCFVEQLNQDFSSMALKEIFLTPTDRFSSCLLLQHQKFMSYIDERINIDFLARALIENAKTLKTDESSEDEDDDDEYKSEVLIRPVVTQVIPLSWVVAYGHSFLLQYLVEIASTHNDTMHILGFDLEEQSRYLVLACYSGCIDTVNFVLRHVNHDCINLPPIKSEVERQDIPIHCNFTPMKMAILRGNSEIFDVLVNANVDINALDFAGWTPLWMAIYASQDTIFNKLISKKADVNTFGKELLSPLILAACLNKSKMIDSLLKKGADCNYRSASRETALYWASRVDNFNSVKQLIEYKADLSMYKDKDKSPFCVAAENGNRAIVELLFSNGANCNFLDKDGRSPIYLASNAGHAEIVKFLLEKRVDINSTMYKPLLAAIRNGYADIAKMLIQAGASLKTHFTYWGFTTPLHEAVYANMADVIQALHRYDLDYRAKNDEGITSGSCNLDGEKRNSTSSHNRREFHYKWKWK